MTTLSAIAAASTCCLAEVVSVEDPDGLGRVEVRFLHADGITGHDGPVWARVAVPFAGGGRGAFLLPDVGDEVLIAFVLGDARHPVVVGSLWHGGARPPETLGGDRVDRWTLVGKAGSRIAIVEAAAGEATISFETADGVRAMLTDDGTTIELEAGGSSLRIEPSGVTIDTPGDVTINGSSFTLTAGQATVSVPQTTSSGVITCQTLTATTVTGATYSLGAGNVW